DIIGTYERTENETIYGYVLRNEEAVMRIAIPLYAPFDLDMKAGDVVLLTDKEGTLTVKVRNADGTEREVVEYAQDAQLVQLATETNAFFEGTQFCQPVHRKDLKAFSTYYEDALTY
ncbi:MAG: hypothetical protein J6U55_02130, partial [Bacteroidaceae bacterium]|nr:hypothetical protein [Bacteroidaceae bacterium]